MLFLVMLPESVLFNYRNSSVTAETNSVTCTTIEQVFSAPVNDNWLYTTIMYCLFLYF